MRLIRTFQSLSCAGLLVAGTATLIPTTARAAVACTEAALVDAITAADAAGGGDVALAPNCTYTLTTSHATGAQGPDGLPLITTAVSLTGTNTVITRSTALPFRIAEVGATGGLTLNSVTLDNGLAVGGGGGGVLNAGAVTLTDSALTGNTASGDGGGILNLGAATFTSSALTDNTTSGTGGGLANAATGTAATFTSSTVSGNTAGGRGGGLDNGAGGTLTTTSTPVSSNTSSAQGGGIAAVDSTATTLTSSPVTANSAALGAGGILRLGGVMTITPSPVTGNTPNDCVGSSPALGSCTT
jgi:hypothetical protein